jgi:hypothetical protein
LAGGWDDRLGRLNELRSEIGAEDLAEVVAMFLDEADDVVGKADQWAGCPELEWRSCIS